MAFSERVKELFEDFMRDFPHCSLLFLATSEGLPLWAEGAEGREEEFSAYFSSFISQTKEVLERLQLGQLRSTLLVTDQGFFNLIPINNSLTLGVVFKARTDYSRLFPMVKGLAERLRKLSEESGL